MLYLFCLPYNFYSGLKLFLLIFLGIFHHVHLSMRPVSSTHSIVLDISKSIQKVSYLSVCYILEIEMLDFGHEMF